MSLGTTHTNGKKYPTVVNKLHIMEWALGGFTVDTCAKLIRVNHRNNCTDFFKNRGVTQPHEIPSLSHEATSECNRIMDPNAREQCLRITGNWWWSSKMRDTPRKAHTHSRRRHSLSSAAIPGSNAQPHKTPLSSHVATTECNRITDPNAREQCLHIAGSWRSSSKRRVTPRKSHTHPRRRHSLSSAAIPGWNAQPQETPWSSPDATSECNRITDPNPRELCLRITDSWRSSSKRRDGVPDFSCEAPITSGAQHRGVCVGKRQGRPVFTKLSKDCEKLATMRHILQSCRAQAQRSAGRNLITLIDGPAECRPPGPYLVMDVANRGDLYRFIVNPKRTEAGYRSAPVIVSGIHQGLTYLHHIKYVHCDVKPANILLHDEGRTMMAKIGDFGTVVPIGKQQPMCTPVYSTAEMVESPAAPARDLFAFVLIIYEMSKWYESPLRIAYLGKRNEHLHPDSIKTLDDALSRIARQQMFPSAGGQ